MVKRCPNCGEEIDDDEELCDECKEEEMNNLASAIIWEPSIPPNPGDFT
jgi:RNA polymerase subunit RPABC4/transcription elongation factor Spt4